MSMTYRDLFSGLAFLIIGAITAWMGKDFYDDAAYVPLGAGSLMSLFALPLIWRSSRRLLVGSPGGQAVATALVDHPGRFLATLGCCLVYYVTLPHIGFYTTSAVFVLVLAAVLGERRPKVVVGITVVFITLLYGLFAMVLRRPLPVEFFLAS
ncbi:Tripartite tricarboxylate transporter TctB family protein [Franzmannia pantelleriensis]|uniref:Tripartite tricarboxylate transporter TctB family protein n=1 Tax=Franzmannia pantelleriensis TaxID=48727 RepID=A0A1G9LU51_9GAMM|nr:tripartite tricarboxylate transporter TctB family protein [Halomonas pantelleriensis]SDL65632.1 Tripartite tricarboxylate transporter TctB family protein [Halomonas pantelleriensis]